MPYVKLENGHITFVPFAELQPFEDEEDGRFYTKMKWGEIARILGKSETENYLRKQEEIKKGTHDWLDNR